jgi:hypothetical protein
VGILPSASRQYAHSQHVHNGSPQRAALYITELRFDVMPIVLSILALHAFADCLELCRSAEQSTEMFRSLRSIAMQLDQGLAEMEELDGVPEEDDDAPSYDAPAMTGPANVEAEPQVCWSVSSRANVHMPGIGMTRIRMICRDVMVVSVTRVVCLYLIRWFATGGTLGDTFQGQGECCGSQSP